MRKFLFMKVWFWIRTETSERMNLAFYPKKFGKYYCTASAYRATQTQRQPKIAHWNNMGTLRPFLLWKQSEWMEQLCGINIAKVEEEIRSQPAAASQLYVYLFTHERGEKILALSWGSFFFIEKNGARKLPLVSGIFLKFFLSLSCAHLGGFHISRGVTLVLCIVVLGAKK